MEIDIQKLSKEQLWGLYSKIAYRLKELGDIRTGNVTGDLGENLAVAYFNSHAGMPTLQLSPVNTQNIDAISIQGERYSVKSISYPNKTTGVFYGMGSPDQPISDKKFEYLLVVVLKDYLLDKIVQIPWSAFVRHKRWHSRMNAFNISLTAGLLTDSEVEVYEG